ncbi:hypothetical protein B0H13DRAFT_1851124 [Mycena leptocephala]|nr:hypothetical protein B0H13DRAFT_1851124 [Mycena leptocephala]
MTPCWISYQSRRTGLRTVIWFRLRYDFQRGIQLPLLKDVHNFSRRALQILLSTQKERKESRRSQHSTRSNHSSDTNSSCNNTRSIQSIIGSRGPNEIEDDGGDQTEHKILSGSFHVPYVDPVTGLMIQDEDAGEEEESPEPEEEPDGAESIYSHSDGEIILPEADLGFVRTQTVLHSHCLWVHRGRCSPGFHQQYKLHRWNQQNADEMWEKQEVLTEEIS